MPRKKGSKTKKTISKKEIDEKGLRKAAPSAPTKPAKPVPTKAEGVKKEVQQDGDWTIHHIQKESSLYSDELNEQILQYMIKLELLTDEQAKVISDSIEEKELNLIEAILEKGFLKEGEIGQAIATFFNCTYVRFEGSNISAEVLMTIPKAVCQNTGAVVFEEDNERIKVAMVNPTDLHFIHLLEKKTGKEAEVHCTTPGQVNEAIKAYPSEFEDKFQNLMARATSDFSHLDSLENVSQVFDSMVLMAFQRSASDVHIEPLEKEIRVRFRVDGVLQTIANLPSEYQETLVNHIKVLAKLRIDTHNAAQDGRFHVNYENTKINFRVSVMPTHYGEKVVLRLLTSETQEWTLSELGYRHDDEALVDKSIAKTNGMILVCGPTGSGKTTTLYAMLKEVNKEGVNISTIEDPIEYGLPGIMQIQVNTKTNITYAEGLKSLMRQDPDILMIGEIRDSETGNIAVNAALTGHLVFSTLHTNNASLAPLRMLQMGVDPYLIVNTVQIIVAQRLVRKLCQGCLTSYTVDKDEIEKIKGQFGLDTEQRELFEKYFGKKSSKARLYKGAGCNKCGGTGFHGRTVIAEAIKMKENIRNLILKNASESEIQKAAEENGMTTMLEDGFNKAIEGVTTLKEVLRVINQ